MRRDEAAPPAAFEVVINYRREDTAGHAGRLYDALASHFGSEHVFMDIDAIDPGADFGEVIASAVDRCQAFIALIGNRWLTATDARGQRRLENPDDFVRIEIETALKRDIRVIPVLVEGVEMPSAEDLPPSLRPLVRRNALEIRDTSWRDGVDRLIATLDELAGRDSARRRRAERVTLIAVAALLLAVAAIGAVLLLNGSDGDDEGTPSKKRGTTSASVSPSTTSTSVSPPPNLLYAEEGQAEEGQVYAAALMGRNKLTNVTKLSREGHDDETPAWSPDHKRIALSRDRHIWTVNSDGTDGQRVTRSANEEGSPEWSPVGDGRIAFDRETNEKQIDVWLRYRDGREENLTFSPTVTGSNPGWSPDGRRIVFQRQTKLWLMRAVPGAQPQQVPVSVSGTIVHPSWSPDGLQIAFTLRASEHGANPCSKDRSDIWVVSPKGRRLRNLTRGRRKRPDNAAWSPESNRLVFADCDGLWLVGRNGERLESLRRGKNLDTPAWAP